MFLTTLWSATGHASGENGSAFEDASVTVPETPLDRIVEARLRELRLAPAQICSDGVFVRRVFLDTIGTLPTETEARAFLDDERPDKRRLLVDALLERPEYADYWALRWGDLLRVKAEFPINLWPNAAQVYHRWLVQALRENRPADAMAREMLVSSGSNFRDGPVNFYRATRSREPEALARVVALTFFGMRAETWPPERLAGLSGFFTGIRYKQTGEWKEEIVFHDFSAQPDSKRPAVFPDGRPARWSAGEDPRSELADWMVHADHPWLARSLANRAWSWFLGRGVVHEPDDFREDNPPVNPALLAYLQRELVAARYDMKALFRLILNSRTYQRSSLPSRGMSEEALNLAAAHFAHHPVRRLEAEVLADAINRITGAGDTYASAIPEPFTHVPVDVRAIALPDGSVTGIFLEKFGRSSRDTGLEVERSNTTNAAQRLHLLNSTHLLRKLDQGPAMRALYRGGRGGADAVIERVYLTVLSRRPTAAERENARGFVRPGDREGVKDLVWALINGAEFVHRH